MAVPPQLKVPLWPLVMAQSAMPMGKPQVRLGPPPTATALAPTDRAFLPRNLPKVVSTFSPRPALARSTRTALTVRGTDEGLEMGVKSSVLALQCPKVRWALPTPRVPAPPP